MNINVGMINLDFLIGVLQKNKLLITKQKTKENQNQDIFVLNSESSNERKETQAQVEKKLDQYESALDKIRKELNEIEKEYRKLYNLNIQVEATNVKDLNKLYELRNKMKELLEQEEKKR